MLPLDLLHRNFYHPLLSHVILYIYLDHNGIHDVIDRNR